VTRVSFSRLGLGGRALRFRGARRRHLPGSRGGPSSGGQEEGEREMEREREREREEGHRLQHPHDTLAGLVGHVIFGRWRERDPKNCMAEMIGACASLMLLVSVCV